MTARQAMTGRQAMKRLDGHEIAKREAGFTLVELLVGGMVAMIGMFASMQLALTALNGNTERRASILAEQLAQHMLATIQTSAVNWTAVTPDGVPYLAKLPSPPAMGQTTGWLMGNVDPLATDKRVGPLGHNTTFDNGLLQEMPSDRGTRYCTHYRLTWVTQDLVRAEVRVSWPRPSLPADQYSDCPANMVYDVGNVGSITLPAMVMRNVYAQ